jgi:coenzyme F420-reducing hydrogenase gamma subunit
LHGVLKALSAKYNFNNSQNVILISGPAGGISVFLYADYLQKYLYSSSETSFNFVAVPIHERHLVDHTATGCPILPERMKHIFEVSEAKNGVNIDCIFNVEKPKTNSCVFPPFF